MSRNNGHNGRGGRPRLEEIVRRAAAPDGRPAGSDGPAMSRSQRVLLLLLGALFVVAALAILDYGAPALGLRQGDKAQADYPAREDFSYQDPRISNDLRKEVLTGTPNIYTQDPNWAAFVSQDIKALAKDHANAKDLDSFKKAVVDDKLVPDGQKAEALWNDLEGLDLHEDLIAPLDRKLASIQETGLIKDERQRTELDRRRDIRIEVRVKGRPDDQARSTLEAARCYTEGTAKKEVQDLLDVILRQRAPELRETVRGLLLRRLQPSLSFEPELSAAALKAAMSGVDFSRAERKVKKGDILLRSGDVIGEPEIRLLRSENLAYWNSRGTGQHLARTAGLLALIVVLFGVTFAWIGRSEPEVLRRTRLLVVLGFLAVAVVLVARIAAYRDWPVLIVPAVFFSMAAAMVLSARAAAGLAVLVCGLSTVAAGGGLYGAAALSAGALAGALAGARPRHHLDVLRAALIAGLVIAAAAAAGQVLSGSQDVGAVLRQAGWGLGGALVQGLVLAGALPLLEAAFGTTTSVSLRVLCDPNQSAVLRTLFLNAPNSYHHCAVVGMLGESAAAAVGANPLLARAGGYYHDIGKISRPEYFVENAPPGENRHDRLTPAMSATVVIAHVRDGAELARSFRLPRSLIGIIEQHHGTTRAEFFYRRALDRGEQPAESIFRYPGPRPQSKEAAIIMLADAVEAASRTLEAPSLARIEALVRDISRRRLLEGQFDECGMTLRELSLIEATFTRILVSMFHARIAYPDDKDPKEPAPRR